MKKKILVALFLGILLCGCQNKVQNDNEKETNYNSKMNYEKWEKEAYSRKKITICANTEDNLEDNRGAMFYYDSVVEDKIGYWSINYSKTYDDVVDAKYSYEEKEYEDFSFVKKMKKLYKDDIVYIEPEQYNANISITFYLKSSNFVDIYDSYNYNDLYYCDTYDNTYEFRVNSLK